MADTDDKVDKQLCSIAWIALIWNGIDDSTNNIMAALLDLHNQDDVLMVATRINGFEGKQAIIRHLMKQRNFASPSVRKDIDDALSHAAACKIARDNVVHTLPNFQSDEGVTIRNRGKTVRINIARTQLTIVEEHIVVAAREMMDITAMATAASAERGARIRRDPKDMQRHRQRFEAALAQFQGRRKVRLGLRPLPAVLA